MKKQKKYYLIYQITNNLNHKIYIGKHKTDRLDDDYFGSGQYLKNAQEKYGLENFTKTILFYCANEEEMNLLEQCVVTPEFCAREDVYNIKEGGEGGWDYVNITERNVSGNWNSINVYSQQIFEEYGYYPGVQAHLSKLSTDQEYYDAYCKKVSDGVRAYIQENGSVWQGRKHTETSKQKMKATRQRLHPGAGEKNSQYGTIAIYNETTFERATQPKDQPIPEGWAKGRFYKATPEELIQRKKILDEILRLDPASKATIRMNLDHLQKILDKILNPVKHISKEEAVQNSELKRLQKKQTLEQKIALLCEMYKYYDQYGFKALVEKYDYKYSSENFVQQCKKYVPEYVPQAGKKRGKLV